MGGANSICLQSMTGGSIIGDVESQVSSIESDRMSFLSNCCGYERHFNVDSTSTSGFRLNTCILALFLLNGELLHDLDSGGIFQPCRKPILTMLGKLGTAVIRDQDLSDDPADPPQTFHSIILNMPMFLKYYSHS